MTGKIEIKEVPKLVCISFVHERAMLEFDNTFSVPLDRQRSRQCTRAIEVYEAYKRGEVVELE